ncbi:MAG: type V CRISPR-associated protein Cas12a/Cpf1, partial [Bacteroidales bacterium]|nr:type V CRISPR-associated protein Cas12a/Cpf1 [Bacteroidales bacterium]
MKTFSNFTRLYPIQKTLRFELKPIGKTKENIEKSGILERDNERAIAYKAVKKVMDEFHKSFIENKLKDFKLNNAQLKEFDELYNLPAADTRRKNDMPKLQESLRKQISDRFTKDDYYKRLFGKELIREDLREFVNTPYYENVIRAVHGNEQLTDEEIKQIQENTNREIAQFHDFTTYFVGFYENRKNMYVADEKATSIAHRMINENLPKFVDNMDVFEKIAASDVSQHFGELYKNMESYLNVASINEMFQLDYFSMVLTQTQIDVYNAIIGGKTLDDGTKIQGLNEYVNLYNQKQKDKTKRLPKLKPLFKQILSERNAISWLPEEF